ncbi:tyrosine-type recombinase/integrase [Rummeliibacillus sp. JY-2-4R]
MVYQECMKKFKEDYEYKFVTSTLSAIQCNVYQFFAYCKKSIQDVTSSDIRSWLIQLHEDGYASTTVRTKLFRIKPFFGFCLEEKIITHNPTVSIIIPEEKQITPRYLEIDQLNQLRQLVSGKLRQKAAVELLYATGVRIRELCAIKQDDINWSERSILIQNGKGKRERIVLFTNECGNHLKAYLQERTDSLPFLFINRYENGPISPRAIQRWFENYQKELGIQISPHTMRHTFAAHLAIKGMSQLYIQALLGHEIPRHTELYTRLYNHARKQQYDEWM